MIHVKMDQAPGMVRMFLPASYIIGMHGNTRWAVLWMRSRCFLCTRPLMRLCNQPPANKSVRTKKLTNDIWNRIAAVFIAHNLFNILLSCFPAKRTPKTCTTIRVDYLHYGSSWFVPLRVEYKVLSKVRYLEVAAGQACPLTLTTSGGVGISTVNARDHTRPATFFRRKIDLGHAQNIGEISCN